MKRDPKSLLLMPVVVLFLLSPGQAGETKALMDDYFDTFVGTWQTTMILEEDVEGQGKKGDVVSFVGTNRKILNGNAVECAWKSGEVRGKALSILDRNEKHFRLHGADSTGMALCITYFKKDDKWHADLIVSSPDGSKSTSYSVLTVSDNGDTHTWVYTKRKKDGEKLPDETEVWHRKK